MKNKKITKEKNIKIYPTKISKFFEWKNFTFNYLLKSTISSFWRN